MGDFILEVETMLGRKKILKFTDSEKAIKKFNSGFYKAARLTREIEGTIFTIAKRSN